MANDYEYVYNGLTFGGSTAYGVDIVEGLSEPPEIREDVSEAPGRHGGFAYMDFFNPRIITFTGDIVDPTSGFEATVLAMKTAMLPQPVELPLVFKRPNLVQQRVYAKPARMSLPYDFDYNLSNGQYALRFIAADPLIYADTLVTRVLAQGVPDSPTVGGIVPMKFETVVITGPGTDFRLRDASISPNPEIKILTTLAGGESMTLNFKDRTVVKNTGANLYGYIDQSVSTWWSVNPGVRDFRFTVTSGSTGATTATLNYRPAWV